jgi:MFS family permease
MAVDQQVENGDTGLYTAEELERLGRERPDTVKNVWAELIFCFSLFGSIFMAEYFTSGFNILLPPVVVSLNIPSKAETWPASVFSLVTGAFLLPIGRFADMYGGKLVFIAGLVWILIWSIISGFSQNYVMLIFCRALQGLGPAAFLPSGIMLLGSIVSKLTNILAK